MKRTTIAIAILCASNACAVYADTTTTTPADNKTAATTQPANDADKSKDSSSSGSVYDSVKSGWNSFIDALTGPPNQSK